MTRLRVTILLFLLGLLARPTTLAGTPEDERDWSQFPVAEGPFNRSWDSLNRWECPEWFRDAKLGFWFHWGPQAVPMQGDWYARKMYLEGDWHHTYHQKTYGHQSEFGYKDIINLFDPKEMDFDKLVGLYKECGARYVVMLAVHHDNYDLWDSKHHTWDAVDKMPHRDLVGEFQRAAVKHNLRYGLSAHIDRGITWMQASHGCDQKGPKRELPYDGVDPRYRDLYFEAFDQDPGQIVHRVPWNPPAWWEKNWFDRMKDLVDNYRPDLLYFDGSLPFRHDDYAVGRQLLANYYNDNIDRNGGRLEAVMNLKDGKLKDLCVVDSERRGRAGVLDDPWQTDTCIGNWYYNENWLKKYKTVPQVVGMLLDIVSKNGNLLLSIPVHPSGALQKEELDFLAGFGPWMRVNGDGVYGTRPWIAFGEGDLQRTTYGVGGGMHERKTAFGEGDFRFTSRGGRHVYAFFMAWPESGRVTIRSLARQSGSRASVERVRMLGAEGELEHAWTAEGLTVTLPAERPCKHAWGLAVEGRALRDFRPVAQDAADNAKNDAKNDAKPPGAG